MYFYKVELQNANHYENWLASTYTGISRDLEDRKLYRLADFIFTAYESDLQNPNEKISAYIGGVTLTITKL